MAIFFGILLLPIFFLLSYYVYYRRVLSKYWAKRNVPHMKPSFPWGVGQSTKPKENFNDLLARIHLENRRKRILGIWMVNKPTLMVMDREIIKRILIRDFTTFRNHGIEIDTKLDPISGSLFMLKGKEWRNLRVKLTPTFTSGKMKMMFSTMKKCGEELLKHLERPAESGEVLETKDLMARFTTDVISSCAFGIETNCLKNPNSEFRKYGNKIFEPTVKSQLSGALLFLYPRIASMLRVTFFPKDVSDFFIKVVRETIEYRERTKTTRNDFLQLMIQLMRAGKIEDADKTPIDGMTDEEMVQKFSLNEAAAQCFGFFTGGSESTSTALLFALYELALNPDIQRTLQEEIDTSLTDGDITYEKLNALEYLDMVVQETLRKYPPVALLQRKCAEDYPIPELGVVLEKDTGIMISVSGLQKDPDIYPEPDRFWPERFSAEERAKRDACSFLTFGEGPRNCIGSRFALMQIKIGLFYILRAYNVNVAKTTPIPIVYHPKTVIPAPINGLDLAFSKR